MIALTLLLPALAAAAPAGADSANLQRRAERAPAALRAPITTVVDGQSLPGGNPHDYVSYARYYWPDPTKPDGLPFVSRDGHHNHEQVARGDRHRIDELGNAVEALTAAWVVRRDEAAARRAAEWLRAWFVDPATRMNPNLDYAQVRLGHHGNRGNAAGLIDTRRFGELVESLALLRGSPAFGPDDEAAVRQWFGRYLDWLLTAPNAREERAAANNHGSWYLAQAVPIALYVGRTDLAREFVEEDKARIGRQIQPDGSQPEELRRVDGLGYSRFNLEAQFRVAQLAATLGVDLWNYTAPSGGSLRRAYEFLLPYDADPQTWPHNQREKLAPGFMTELRLQAAKVWPDVPANKPAR